MPIHHPFRSLVYNELKRARGLHKPLHSLHEAYAVILEELEEFKAEVFKSTLARNDRHILEELVQVAAMCERTAEDLGYTGEVGPSPA